MKCPGCSAFINPAWERCHACGGVLKSAAFMETVKPDTSGPATEQDFQLIADRHWNRTARLMPEGTYQTISEAWPGLYQRIKAADMELNGLWQAARRDGTFPDNFRAFKNACRKWCRLNLEAARYVRYLDRGIRRIYSQRLGEWVYLAKDKAALHGIRLKPRGTVYVGEELKSLIAVNPGPDELKKLHWAKTIFEGEFNDHR